jgi:MoaA/NifB/PqqE/SkfB family radical SAM enzyme
MILCDTQKVTSFVKDDVIHSYDKIYNFKSSFNMKTGFYYRSGIIKDGKDTGKDPFMGSVPHLLDIGIMGHCQARGVCKQGGIDCYQSGFIKDEPNMSIDLFTKIINQCRGMVYEIALGGRGDPNKHENFKEFMKLCRDNFIAPNYTTSGIGLTDEEVQITKEYAGAVAVSWQRQDHTINALNRFIEAGVTTNIHYVLSNKTIDELISIIKENKVPKGLNALIILNYKNIGQGDVSNVITGKESNLNELFELLDKPLPFKIGFDSCSCQFIGNYMKNVVSQSVSSCDSGCFSAYISPSGVFCPCSFDQVQLYGVNLNEVSIEDAWDSLQLELFRKKQQYGLESGKCQKCKHHIDICKPCVLVPDINICNKEC